MAVFTEPKKWGVVPGNAADISEIQEEGSSLYPSLADFFPAIYQLALSAGGKAPERTTFNALFKMIMERLYYIERGGMWSYDATADYPAGAVVGHSGSLYLAMKDNGEGTDAGAVAPDADGEVWQRLETAADVADTYLSKDDASDTYQTKADLSSQITATVKSGWYTNFPDGAEAHNAMWGGRDITAAFNNGTVSANIANGTFKDIFPGDFITKAITVSGKTYTVDFVIADLDYRYNLGSTPITAHHAVIIPRVPPFDAYMNSTNTTSGAFVGSAMFTSTIPAFAAGLTAAFGSGHLVQFSEYHPTQVNTSAVSSGYTGFTGASTVWNASEKWYTLTCNLMCSMMVFGAPIASSSFGDSYSVGSQFAAFRLNQNLLYANRHPYWLRDVASSSHFASVGGSGVADSGGAGVYYASYVRGVRPFALLR